MSCPDQLIHVLERLKVSLSTYYISWVQKFAEKGGHRKLNKVLNKWNQPVLKDESKCLFVYFDDPMIVQVTLFNQSNLFLRYLDRLSGPIILYYRPQSKF